MTAHTDITKLAGQILTELETAVEAGEELRRENRGIGTRLRLLLTMTYACEGPIHDARLDILQAIGRTEVSDEMRRGGACHVGAGASGADACGCKLAPADRRPEGAGRAVTRGSGLMKLQ